MQQIEMRLVAGRYDSALAAEQARALLDGAGIAAVVLPPASGWTGRLARVLGRRPAYLLGVPPDAAGRAKQLLAGEPHAPAA